MIHIVEEHYKNNRMKLLKILTFRAGTVEAAEDIIQESYLRALKYISSCRNGEFDKWITRIITNTLKDYKRQESGKSYIENDDEQEIVDCPAINERIADEVKKLIENKLDIHREILELHFLQGYSAIDISRITDNSYANSHKVIQRFRNELKDIYKE